MAKTTPKPTPAAPETSATTLKVEPHKLVSKFIETWQLLAEVREGTGGFSDGTALIAHPREWQDFDVEEPRIPTKKLKARRKLASYENIAESLIEALAAALFREHAVRRFGSSNETPKGDAALLAQWWEDVDGAGTHADDFFAEKWDIAASFGHVFIYMDRPKGTSGPTAADATRPFLRVYTPLDVVTWAVDGMGQITDILFREISDEQDKYTYRRVNTLWWAYYGEDGELREGGPVDGLHQMGAMPVVQLFSKRRPLYRHIGKSVLGDPKLYRDVYNLASEIRELLRAQAFSFINIPLGTGQDRMSVDEAKALLGGQIGAMNVIFSGLSAQILAGDSANVVIYHQEMARKLRTIYRTVGVQWEADSKDAEATGSLKLKREDMNTRLAKYADEVERVDYAIAKLWFRAMRGADAGPKAFEESKLEIKYPDTFDMTPFDVVLEQAQAALALDYPLQVLNEILKSLLPKFLPDIEEETLRMLADAIDARTDQPTAFDQVRARLLQVAQSANPTAIADATGAAPPQPDGQAGV